MQVNIHIIEGIRIITYKTPRPRRAARPIFVFKSSLSFQIIVQGITARTKSMNAPNAIACKTNYIDCMSYQYSPALARVTFAEI